MSLKLIGHLGSPYSRKFRAFLRYKQIPFEFVRAQTEEADALPTSKIPIMPALYFPYDNYATGHTDSTPLIRAIDQKYPTRITAPKDPAISFLNDVMEDFADEWVVKAMFHYRWKYDEEHNSEYLMLASHPNMDHNMVKMLAKTFRERQINRLDKVVGVNDTTSGLVEEGYTRILEICNSIITQNKFLLGNRPSSADFSFFGQYAQLVGLDPTPSRLAVKHAPRMKPWCDVIDDLSGMADMSEDTWITRSDLVGSVPHHSFFNYVNDIYMPFLRANAKALNSGEKEFSVELKGSLWKQNTFPYQAKCLKQLYVTWEALSNDDKDFVRCFSLNFP